MTEEVWKPVLGFEGLYEISSHGKVRKGNGKPFNIHKNPCGYYTAALRKNGKVYPRLVHRMVVESFICKEFEQVDHIDGRKGNNLLSNLRPCTQRENMLYHYKREFPGTFREKDKWRASISVKNEMVHLGTFETEVDAFMAYKLATKVLDAAGYKSHPLNRRLK